MNFSVVLELATFVAFAVVLLGGRGNRENGWKMCVGLLGVVVIVQVAAMGIVVSVACFLYLCCGEREERRLTRRKQAFLFDHDNRFFVGWKLDKSWILCTVSWIVLLMDVVGITVAAKMLPAEDDYEPIPDRR